jgi:Universal stress protein UspA and related nucleotide-binding proteins
MSAWKSIAVFMDLADPEYRVADYAAMLAQHCDAHLIGIFNIGGSAPGEAGYTGVRGEAAIQETIARRRHREQQSAYEAGEHLAKLGRLYGISVEFRVLWRVSEAEDAILSSLHCDLVVIEDRKETCLPPGVTAERVVFEVGVPVVIVPEDWAPRGPMKKVLVAWNVTREARRAMADAIPCISMAEETILLVVDPDRSEALHGELPGMDAAHYLARHGAKVRTRSENSYGRGVHEVIGSVAQQEAADLIVMGAYSKPRHRQLFFGGVTRSMLGNIRYPVLISR